MLLHKFDPASDTQHIGSLGSDDIPAGLITPEKLSNGIADVDSILFCPDGGPWQQRQVYLTDTASRWERAAGTSLHAGPGTWVLLDFPTCVLDNTGEVDRTEGHVIYTPDYPGNHWMNLWLRVWRPTMPTAWTAADIRIGYRIDDHLNEGDWVELDCRPFSTTQDACTLVGPTLEFLYNNDIGGDPPPSHVVFGFQQMNGGPFIFPNWQGRLEIRRGGFL